MKKLIAAICTSILFLYSCTSNKKAMQSKPYIMPDLPYRALDKKSLDTTFDYQVLQAPIYALLPDSIFGNKIKGTVEFYSMIDANKRISDIKLIECKFYKGQQLVYEYNEKMNSQVYSRLKNYLLVFIQDKPFKQSKAVTLQQHPTYCYIGFYK